MLAQILFFLELALKILFFFRGLGLKFGQLLPQFVELVIEVCDHLAHDRHSFTIILGSSQGLEALLVRANARNIHRTNRFLRGGMTIHKISRSALRSFLASL